MAFKSWVQQRFYGGMATDAKVGIQSSFAYSQSFDFRKSPSQMSVLPAPTREDGEIVQDLLLNEVMTGDGSIFAFGNRGYFYKRTTTGTWSVEGKLSSGCAGIDYRKDTDSIYLASNKAVSLYTPILGLGTPTLVPDNYASSFSTYNNSSNAGFNVSAYQAGSNQTTAIKVATNPLDEAPGNIRYFQSDIEPLNKISVFIVSKGTGNWTLTLHDGLNNVLGTATVANASLKNNDWNDFVFSSAVNGQVRIYVAPNARTYHVHVTSTVANGTVSSSASNDLSSCDLQVWADRLVQTSNGLHPIQRFLQYETFGNGNYLSVWEPLSTPPTNDEWKRHALVFPREYEVCGLAAQNEFLVIALEQNTTTSGTPQQGLLAFWDGTSNTYNYYLYIPEGSPQALHTYKNVAYYYAGGSWWAITSADTQPVKIRTMPGSDSEFSAVGSTTATTNSAGQPYAATLTDNFNSSSSLPDPSKWDTFGNVSQANGTLQLTTNTAAGSHGINSHITTYDMTTSSAQVRLAAAGNQSLTSLEVYPVLVQQNANNQVGWYVSNNQIKAYSKVAGVVSFIQSASYVAATFQYLRVRASSSQTFWDYSADGVTWSTLASSFNLIDMTSVVLEVTITSGAEATTTTILADDFNITSSVAPITLYPYAAAIRRNIHLMAYPSTTSITTINYGVYSWGAIDKNYPESFGYSYIISTGAQNFSAVNNLQIGMVKSFGDLLHISWRDDQNGGYGIDVVSNSSFPASYAKYQSLIIDSGYAAKQKIAQYIEAYYYVPTGTSITLGYSVNRGTFVTDPVSYTPSLLWQGQVGYARFNVTPNAAGRYQEFQGQVEMRCDNTATQPPVLYMFSVIYDDGSSEVLQ